MNELSLSEDKNLHPWFNLQRHHKNKTKVKNKQKHLKFRFELLLMLILQVKSLQVNPSATCVSSTPTTTCSAWPSRPAPHPPPPDSTVQTLTPRTAGARWGLRWASRWAAPAAAAAPVWAAPARAASGWDRRRRRRASRHPPLTSGTSSPGKGRARRRWYDKGRGWQGWTWRGERECVLLSEVKVSVAVFFYKGIKIQ